MREFTPFRNLPVFRLFWKSRLSENSTTRRVNSTAGSNSIGDLEISIHNNLIGLEKSWRELEKNSNISIYQRFDWVNTCINTFEREQNSRVLIVTVRKAGEMVFILPLAVQNGLVRKLRWVGGGHANYNLPLIENNFANSLKQQDVQAIFSQFSRMLPGIGYLRLCSQPVRWRGMKNPLLALAHQQSTNNAFRMDLSKGFDDLLNRLNAKRKRKKYRSQLRAVRPMGGARLVEADTREKLLEMLKCFHRQKSDRLRTQGLRDVFGGKGAHSFLERMALDSLSMDEPILKLFALEVAGEYRAVFGGGVQGTHFSAYFTSFANTNLARISPGEMLLYMLIEKLVEDGFQSMDLGGGEERYKLSWCPQTIEMFDVILPLSVFSCGHVWAHRTSLVLKRFVRKNPLIWSTFKRTRAIKIQGYSDRQND